jgi:hypothetical protein
MEVIDAVLTPYEYAVSMIPHWTWVDLALRITFDLLTMSPAYFNHAYSSVPDDQELTYEMLIELSNHPDLKAAMYNFQGGPLSTLYYRPTPTFDMEFMKQTLDEIVVNDLEEVLLESLHQDGVDTHRPGFRLYSSADLQSRTVETDIAIWRFLITVFYQVIRAAQGIGAEYGLRGHALAKYRNFMPATPIHGGQSEYLYAVTIREE